ncbi:MAG TPA: hypothetical protein VMU34_15585, partial [Mycobacterium sp.]|nr:hypothetical protein [Mycobacterium sp.]
MTAPARAQARADARAQARAEALRWMLDNRCEAFPRRDFKRERTLLWWTSNDFRVSMPDRRGAIL